MPNKCKHVTNLGGNTYECHREEYQNGRCVFHMGDLRQVMGKLKDALRAELRDDKGDEIDLRQLTLQSISDVFEDAITNKKVVFDGSAFNVRVDFKGTKFLKGCSFADCDFGHGATWERCEFGNELSLTHRHSGGPLKLVNCTYKSGVRIKSGTSNSPFYFLGRDFKGDFDCSDTTIHAITIKNSTFRDLVTFEGSTISQLFELNDVTFKAGLDLRANGFPKTSYFRGVTFLGKASFSKDAFLKIPLTFENCTLHGLELSDLPILDRTVDTKFDDCEWPHNYRKPWGDRQNHWSRNIIADEREKKRDKHILRLYRWLHNYYYNKSEFKLASSFYVSFMVMKRRLEKRNPGAWLIDMFYSITSRYGESVWRPLLALVFLWLAVPGLLLTVGASLSDGQGYWSNMLLNLQFSTLARFGKYAPPPDSVSGTILFFESILNGLLLVFLGLGIRRTFAPKRPLTERD